MPLRADLRTYRALSPVDIIQDDFSGGVNIRDWPAIGPTDVANLQNLRVVGTKIVAVRPTMSGTPAGIAGRLLKECWWSDVLNCTVARCDDGRLYNLETGVILAGSPAVGANACWVVDFNGILVLGSVTAGIYTCTGAGVWALASNAIHPTMLEVWQDKVWAIGDAAFANRLWASNPGNGAVWTTATDWVDIVEGGNELVSVVATQEQDYQGRPSLLVYKRRAVVRINSANATTGFTYTILGIGTGALGRRAVAADLGLIVAFDDTGLWRTDGLSTPVKVSGKIDPMFGPPQMKMPVTLGGTQDSVISMIAKNGRFRAGCDYFANNSGPAPVLSIEYDSASGAMSFLRPVNSLTHAVCFTTAMWKKLDRTTGLTSLHGIDSSAAAGGGHVLFDDEQSDIVRSGIEDFTFQSRFFDGPDPGRKFNCRRVRVLCRYPISGAAQIIAKGYVDWRPATTFKTLQRYNGIQDPNGLQPFLNQAVDVVDLGRCKAASVYLNYQVLSTPAVLWNRPYSPQDPDGASPYDLPGSPIQIDKVIVLASAAGRS